LEEKLGEARVSGGGGGVVEGWRGGGVVALPVGPSLPLSLPSSPSVLEDALVWRSVLGIFGILFQVFAFS
jgi:hypothetical protein